MVASIVTFSSQAGTGVSQIARPVAEKLRFRYYDWEVIAQAAAEAGVSPEVLAVATAERAPSFFERTMTRLSTLGAGEETIPQTPGQRADSLGSDDYRQFLEHVVLELADRGDAVIVGHSAQALLHDRSGVLKVLLYGGAEGRVRRLAALQNVDLEAARRTVEESDKQRLEFFRRVYRIDWLEAANYDLALNVDHVSPELATDMVAAVARELP